MPKLCFSLATLDQGQRVEFAWIVQESVLRSSKDRNAMSHVFLQIVAVFQQFITLRILSCQDEEHLVSQDDTIRWAIQALGIFGKRPASASKAAVMTNSLPFYFYMCHLPKGLQRVS